MTPSQHSSRFGFAPRPCATCGDRPGTELWGSGLDLSRGTLVMRCQVCVYTDQLAHAQERAAEIPKLKRRLAAAKKANR